MVREVKQLSEKPVIILTGSGAGIGLELARKLYVNEEFNVVITARKHSLDALHNIFRESERFLIRELDVTNNENIYSLVHEVVGHFGRLDVIVNNAAVCYRAVIEHMDVESETIQLQTNYLGPMVLIRAALPIMREQRSGHIINVSSVSGMLAMPTMGSYSASKHALEGATEALWYEARPLGIKVNLAQLGFVNSDSFKRVRLSKKAQISTSLDGPHSEYYRSMTPMIEKFMGFSLTSSSKVADKIVKLIKNPSSRLRLPMTSDAVFFGLIKKIIPSFVINHFLYQLLPGSIRWGGRWKAEVYKQESQKKAA